MGKLANVLRSRLHMLREDALAVAHTVEEAFRGEDELNDEFLDAHLRSVFYNLQDEGVLAIRRTEYDLEGRARRAYFWAVQDDAALAAGPDRRRPEHNQRVYARLGDEAWKRRRPVADIA